MSAQVSELVNKREGSYYMKTIELIALAFILFTLCTQHSVAKVPMIEAVAETKPIPAGKESSDDVAIWLNSVNPDQSRIIGVSKNKKKRGGQAGVGLYRMDGSEVQFILHDRLNNVDLRYDFPYQGGHIDIAAASNRDKRAITVFRVEENELKLLADLKLVNAKGDHIEEEPYGFCLGLEKGSRYRLYAFSPMKNGRIYQHQLVEDEGALQAKFVRIIDTSLYLSRELDQHLIAITVKETIYDEVLPKDLLVAEVIEELDERFQLEGCVVDDAFGFLYYGMENLGVWKVRISPRLRSKPVLITQVLRAKSEPGARQLPPNVPRVINDIEGMAMHYGPSGKGALVVSIQGLDEFAFFGRQNHEYLGSFKIRFTSKDPVTETDGFDLLSSSVGSSFPEGVLVVHDHHNTDGAGNLLNGNYKIVSLADVLKHFPALRYGGYRYDPRR